MPRKTQHKGGLVVEEVDDPGAATPLDSVRSIDGGGDADQAEREAELSRPEATDDGADEADEAPSGSGMYPLRPPEDCEPVTEDGGVMKRVISEGTGDKPPRHARCLGGSPAPGPSPAWGPGSYGTEQCTCARTVGGGRKEPLFALPPQPPR